MAGRDDDTRLLTRSEIKGFLGPFLYLSAQAQAFARFTRLTSPAADARPQNNADAAPAV